MVRNLSLILAYIIACIIPCKTIYANPPSFETAKTTFKVEFQQENSQFKVIGIFVMPKEKVTFKVTEFNKSATFEISTDCHPPPVRVDLLTWHWEAPKLPGLYFLTILQNNPVDSMQFNVFVMVPLDSVKGDYLNGYRIGKYPEIPLKNLPIYKKPKGLIEVTSEIAQIQVSPHFTIGQFLCKQEGDYPKYLALRTRLVRKLERILEEVNREGYFCSTFYIMSGYRTPYYNKSIDNVKYSRHIWGGAADIFIDENPVDGIMDDLNGDGLQNFKDAEILYNIIDNLFGRAWYEPFIGGLGWYRKTDMHGPFVHVDVRGFRARWGD